MLNLHLCVRAYALRRSGVLGVANENFACEIEL